MEDDPMAGALRASNVHGGPAALQDRPDETQAMWLGSHMVSSSKLIRELSLTGAQMRASNGGFGAALGLSFVAV